MFSEQETDVIGIMAVLPIVIMVYNEPSIVGHHSSFFVLHYKIFHIHNEESHKNESMYVHVSQPV